MTAFTNGTTHRDDAQISEQKQAFSAGMQSFLATHQLFSLIQDVVLGVSGDGKLNRNRSDFALAFSISTMAIFGDQLGRRSWVLEKIAHEVEGQTVQAKARLIPEFASTVERLYRHAPKEERAEVIPVLLHTLRSAADEIPDLHARMRAYQSIIEKLGVVLESAPVTIKMEIGERIKNDLFPTMIQHVDREIEVAKDEKKILGYTALRDRIIMTSVVAIGRLYQSFDEEISIDDARLVIDQLRQDAKSRIADTHFAEAVDVMLVGCLLKLHYGIDWESKQSLLRELFVDTTLTASRLSRYGELVTDFLGSSSESPETVIGGIIEHALNPIVEVGGGVASSIAIPRIITRLCRIASTADRRTVDSLRDTINRLKERLGIDSDCKYFADEKSTQEVGAKIERALGLLSWSSTIVDIEGLLSASVRDDPDSESRRIAGIAQNLSIHASTQPTATRFEVATLILDRIIPAIDNIQLHVLSDANGQSFIDTTPKIRAYSRVATTLAELFHSCELIDRLQAESMIRERVLAPMIQLAGPNKNFVRWMLNCYEGGVRLLGGSTNDIQSSIQSINSHENYQSLTEFSNKLNEADRSQFYLLLGAFGSSELIDRLLVSSEVAPVDKSSVIFGAVFFHELFPLNAPMKVLHELPAQEIEKARRAILENTVTDADAARIADYYTGKTEARSWGEAASLLAFIARNPERHAVVLRDLLVSLRLNTHRGLTTSSGVNIEQIPRLVLPALGELLDNPSSVCALYAETRALIRALPLDSFLINEIRIASYKLFDEKLVPVRAQFLQVLRTVFHNLPSPRHLLVMRAFVSYLATGSDLDRNRLDSLMTEYQSQYDESIQVPSDFIQQLGDARQVMLSDAIKVRDLYEDLYGVQQARGIIRTLLDRKQGTYLPTSVSDRVKRLLVSISHETNLDEVPTRLAKTFKTAASYPPAALLSITKDLAELRGAIRAEMLQPTVRGEGRIYLIRLQNACEPLVFSFLNSLRESWSTFSPEQRKEGLQAVLQIAVQDVPNEGRLYQELLVIDSELAAMTGRESDSRMHALLTRLQRVVTALQDYVIDRFQDRAEVYGSSDERIEEREVLEFSANILRESMLFPLQLTIERAFDDLFLGQERSLWSVTRAGVAVGRLVYIENPEDAGFLNTLQGDEIIVIDYISPSLAFPRVRGIITRVGTTSLSHLAIHAGQHRIPWATPVQSEYEELVRVALNSANDVVAQRYSFSVQESGVTVSPIEFEDELGDTPTTNHVVTAHHQTTANVSLNYDGSPACQPSAYREDLVGAKANKLGSLSSLLPDKVPHHIAIPFSTVERLLRSDHRVYQLIQGLLLNPDEGVSPRLTALRSAIVDIQIPDSLQAEILGIIEATFSQDQSLMIRSSSSIEDGICNAGAGDYESYPNFDRRLLLRDVLKVVASLYSEKAYTERRRSGFPETDAKMAVLIQELVSVSQKAHQYGFVMNTRNPRSSNPHEVRIELAPGLGEALVSGDPRFAGDAHTFVFDRSTRELRRVSFANKSFKISPSDSEPELIDYSSDPFAIHELPFLEQMVSLFEDGIKIEQSATLGASTPQDCEGVLIENHGELMWKFVQTRPQVNDYPESEATQKSSLLTHVSQVVNTAPSLDSYPPILHNNRIPLASYDLPPKIFGATGKPNLVNLWLDAFEEVLGPGNVLITPIGSLSYMFHEGTIRWEYIDDVDVNFYLTKSTTEWEAWQIEKYELPKIIEAFKRLAAGHHVLVEEGENGSFRLVGKVSDSPHTLKVKPQNLRCLPLTALSSAITEIRAPDGYLPWYGFYGDPQSVVALDSQLLTARHISPGLVESNIATQYRFAHARAVDPNEGGGVRKLKELCRLSIPLGNSQLRSDALALLDAGESENEVKVDELWRQALSPDTAPCIATISRYTADSLLQSKQTVTLIRNSLDTHRIVPGEELFYLYHEKRTIDEIGMVIADCLFLTHLKGGRFFLIDWGFSEYRKSVELSLMQRMRVAFPDRRHEELEAEIEQILKHRVINFVSGHDTVDEKRWMEQYPQLRQIDGVSHLDIIKEWLAEGNRFAPEDSALIEHADHGSVMGMYLLFSSKGSYTKESRELLEQALALGEKVYGTFDHLERRVSGDLVNAQRMAGVVQRLVSAFKIGGSPSEEEVLAVLRYGGGDGVGVFDRLTQSLDAIVLGKSDSFIDASQQPSKELKNELKRAKKLLAASFVGEKSQNGSTVAISRENGFKDPNVRYALAGMEAKIVIDYEPVRDSHKNTIGWKYLSLGRSPFYPGLDVSPLIEILNSHEAIRRDRPLIGDKRSQWIGTGNKKAMLRGPRGIDQVIRNFSLIPPSELVEIIEAYLATASAS